MIKLNLFIYMLLLPSSRTTIINSHKKEAILIDADGVVLGRLAAKIAHFLMGKNKPFYSKNFNLSDLIIVINAKKIKLTGNKADLNKGKVYYRHTGFPGGIKETTAGKMLAGANPGQILEKAVFGMLTRNTLNRQRMKNLRIYDEDSHPHAAQNPKIYNFKSESRKNA